MVKKLLFWVIANAIALAAAAWLVPGIAFNEAETKDRVIHLILVGTVFGLITLLIKPLVTFFSFPFIILTFGLLLVVINAAMLLLTSLVADHLSLHFHVRDFWSAVLGALVISIVGLLIDAVLPDPNKH